MCSKSLCDHHPWDDVQTRHAAPRKTWFWVQAVPTLTPAGAHAQLWQQALHATAAATAFMPCTAAATCAKIYLLPLLSALSAPRPIKGGPNSLHVLTGAPLHLAAPPVACRTSKGISTTEPWRCWPSARVRWLACRCMELPVWCPGASACHAAGLQCRCRCMRHANGLAFDVPPLALQPC